MAVGSLVKKPHGLSPLAERIFEVLAQYTAFPWPVLMTQCQRLKIDPMALSAASASPALVENLATAVGRFTSPDKELRVRNEVAQLVASALQPGPPSRPPR